MGILLNIIISAIMSFGVLFGAYNYAPLSWFNLLSSEEPKLGADITTIAGTDTLKDSRSTINTNFSNLNKYKTETSTTSINAITTLSNLVSIGTITTGGWDGTDIPVTAGGTGSSTLAANQVLLGNGSSQVAVVNGLGASGQVLKSNGAGTPPTWQTQAVDESQAYNWTGTHTWGAVGAVGFGIATATPGTTIALAVEGDALITGTTTLTQLRIATSTLSLNGNDYLFPAVGGASSTVLMKNDSEGLFWTHPGQVSFAIPHLVGHATSTTEMTYSDNTLQFLGAILVENPIEVGNITIDVTAVNTSGTLDITIYSENGQTQMIAITTGTISAPGVATTAVSPAVFLPVGIYYVGINTNGTANLEIYAHGRCAQGTDNGIYASNNLNLNVSGKSDICGENSITAGTPPATITTSTFQLSGGGVAILRFDE